jgi:hypothetical protein
VPVGALVIVIGHPVLEGLRPIMFPVYLVTGLLFGRSLLRIVRAAQAERARPSPLKAFVEEQDVLLGSDPDPSGCGGLLEARARVRLYWVHLVFTGIILVGHLQFWWLFWSSRQVQAWSFFPFLFLLLSRSSSFPSPLFASLISPVQGRSISRSTTTATLDGSSACSRC